MLIEAGTRTISSTELQRRTGAVLDDVAAGETVMVERNGVPLAVISPAPKPHLALMGMFEGKVTQLVSDEEFISPIMEEM